MNSPGSAASALLASSQLRALESESIYIIREVVAEFERPALLFSGGKDSIVMLHLAVKALRPAKLPFPIVHIDTGHNFPEAIEYRDRTVASLGIELIVGSVPDALESGRLQESTLPGASRNQLQTPILPRQFARLQTKVDPAFGWDEQLGASTENRVRAKARALAFLHAADARQSF